MVFRATTASIRRAFFSHQKKAASGGIKHASPPHEADCQEPTQTSASASSCTEEDSRPCLYDRLGGEPAIENMTAKFFEHIGKEQELCVQFFQNVPVQAIQVHQGKFFRVLFGPADERCTPDEVLDYMLATHVRLFRDLGLNETHFDVVAKCFVGALQDCGFSQDEINECVSIVGPLRLAFEYGAKVAHDERLLTKMGKDSSMLPTATMRTFRGNKIAILPPALTPPSPELVQVIGSRDQLRAWTCALTVRLVVDDKSIRALFRNIPYLDMEVYLHCFLEFAFLSWMDVNPRESLRTLRRLRFPLGIAQATYQLTADVFSRVITHFEQVGEELMANDPGRMEMAVAHLEMHLTSFADSHGRRRRSMAKTSRTSRSGRRDQPWEKSSRGMGQSSKENAIFAWIGARRRSAKA